MAPSELRQDPHVSFTQLDTYFRCPLRYRLQYVDRVQPDFVPAALVLGSGIHGAAARAIPGDRQRRAANRRERPGLLREPLGARDRPPAGAVRRAGLARVLARSRHPNACGPLRRGFRRHRGRRRGVGIRRAARPPGDRRRLDRDLVGTLDLGERDADGGLVVVDLKTAARKYSDL
jgi:PD-(D/E)XK nuclease superfamily